jgi:arylsulfatase A-like enzyme
MAATIFALSSVPAPEGIDGKSLIPLLSNPAGRVRDWLPLFNFWGERSAQSMGVVSQDWKYVSWYFGGATKKGSGSGEMTPTEELFHLAEDRVEMANVVTNSKFTSQLASARSAYDAEIAAMKERVIQGHAYEPYPVLFDRVTSWETKEPLLPLTVLKGSDDGERSLKSKGKKRKNAN